MATKMSIVFDGFDKLAARLDETGKDIKPAVEEALVETQKLVQKNLESAAEPYMGESPKAVTGEKYSWRQGNMYRAIIKNPHITWDGFIAEVKVGFSAALDREGFMHSIFVMYGVPFHGKFNHGYAKDTKIYNAIKGVRTKNQIKKLQKKIISKYMNIGR